ncbi:helix-turn-helix domain-containing protein [Paenibacillus campi]|uniref:helix-turn-helix domain-containing protein n=1 Tax=Paenibacillus campi TaxID=3106031 RepID=UPI002AFFAE8E|nr:helix-turn-helix domain-containing protein [Paenibacillus sp. SGZ-1014]
MVDEVSFETGYFFGPNEIFDNPIADLYEKMVYLYLCRCANNSAAAFPSYQTIADKCSMSRRKAVNVVDSLIAKNLLSKTIRRGDEKNQSNLYKVLPASAQHAPPLVHTVHHPSAQHAPAVVHDMHQGSAQRAPYKELSINNQFIKNQLQATTTEPNVPEEEMKSEKTVGDIYTEVFGSLQMTGVFRKYFLDMRAKGVTDEIFCEAMLEAGESASGKPNQRFLDSILTRWIEKGIKSREEAKQHKAASAPSQRRQYNRQPDRPKPEIVRSPPRGESPTVSQQELDEVMELARKLGGGSQ